MAFLSPRFRFVLGVFFTGSMFDPRHSDRDRDFFTEHTADGRSKNGCLPCLDLQFCFNSFCIRSFSVGFFRKARAHRLPVPSHYVCSDVFSVLEELDLMHSEMHQDASLTDVENNRDSLTPTFACNPDTKMHWCLRLENAPSNEAGRPGLNRLEANLTKHAMFVVHPRKKCIY